MRIIRASEIGEYVFCHRAWWLRHVGGHASANVREMAEGTSTHARHAMRVAVARWLPRLALLLLAGAIVLFVLSLLPHT